MTRFLIGMQNGLYRLEEGLPRPEIVIPTVQPTAIALDPSDGRRIYCSTYDRGLWRSDDAGDSWQPIGTTQSYFGPPASGSIAESATTFVAVEPTPSADGQHALWVGTELSRLYRSSNLGRTFELVTDFSALPSRSRWSFPPRPNTHHVKWLGLEAGRKLFISIEFGAVLRSLDGGRSIEDRRADSPLDAHVLRLHPAAPGRLYTALGDGLMRAGRSWAESRDGGDSWSYMSVGLEAMPYLYGMAIDAVNPDNVRVAAAPEPYAAHSRGGPSSIFRLDRGRWIEDADGFPGTSSFVPVLTAHPTLDGRFYALSNEGLFEQRSGAHSWRCLAEAEKWRDAHPMCLAIVPDQ